MCQIFCCSIVQGVSFNYYQRNVRSRVSVSNFQVSVWSRLLWQSLGLVSKFEIWTRSRSRRLRSRLHHCIPGNDTADASARLSTTNGPSPTDVVNKKALTKLSLSESTSSISNYCWQLWNDQDTASNKATHYKLLFPNIDKTLQHSLPPKIFRLCTGHCQLNGHLHKLWLHLNGYCDTCGTPETVEHILIRCSKFNRGQN